MADWTMRRQTTGNSYSKVYIIIEETAMCVVAKLVMKND